MKSVFIYIFFVQYCILFYGCEKEMMAYEGKEGVYFAVRHNDNATILPGLWPYQPYSNVQFARIGLDETEFEVNVAITGPVKDYDRVFRLAIDPDSTTAIAGKHYGDIQEEWTVPAGAISTTVEIPLKRTPDLEENPVTLGLRLISTKDFELSFPEWEAIPEFTSGNVVREFDASLHALRIDDIMVRPTVWSGSLQADNRESGLLGVFSRRKMDFLMENLGLAYEDFVDPETMPIARQMLVANDGAAILIKRLSEQNPVLEEDGRLMWMGTVPWKSYVGVPWVPGHE